MEFFRGLCKFKILNFQFETSAKVFFCGLHHLVPSPLMGEGRVGVIIKMMHIYLSHISLAESYGHPPPSPSPQGRGKFRGILKLLQRSLLPFKGP
ncbi:MAG: hypothetical protein A3D89_06115 [Planctomycetes bacterium RIFCSPHIGHO2_02_FULL_52_58]|nr:MAG: hypothetical protein A3D89_06115 [Planctomycetes bacterium RIFCSPHIGHO2_02_FULL_52_58]